MSEENSNRTSQEIIDELIRISTEEKEEKEAKIIELKKEVEAKYYGIKKPLIINAKNALLKEGFQKDKITAEIVRRLEGYITEVYIRRCIDDPELKDASKVRKQQIEVSATGEQQLAEEGDNNNNNNDNAREEYERNKYYKNLPSIKNTTLPNQALTQNIGSDSRGEQQTDERDTLIQQLKQKIQTIESERSQHTTVIIGKELFPELLQYLDDKKVKRIFVDFDENMAATKIRVNL